MDTPIINPIIFYLIYLADKILIIFWVLLILFVLITSGYIIFKWVDYCESHIENKAEYIKIARNNFLKLLIITLAFTLPLILIPSSDTIYKMMVASQVTPNNIEIVGDTVESSVDYIFEKINDVVEGEENDEL